MQTKVEAMANQAIFHLQFDTRAAVSYVRRNASVNHSMAQSAVNAVIKWYKKK